MINLDALSMMQIMFLFMVFVGVVVLGIKIYKFPRNCICKLLKKEYRRALNYARGLTVKDYSAFEKYDIWRYFAHFKELVYALIKSNEQTCRRDNLV